MSAMASGSPVPQLPNPLTSMAWLPPETAHQLLVGHNMLFGALGVCITDIHFFTHSDVTLDDIGLDLGRLDFAS